MINETVSLLGIFLEGLLAFFSPCVLPLIPLYIGYLSVDASSLGDDKKKARTQTTIATLCFVLGIGMVFVITALGVDVFATFFKKNEVTFKIVGGILLVVFGLFSLDVIQLPWLNQERRMNMPQKGNKKYLNAFLMGFAFSFAWSPCVGPMLASALVLAANASTRMMSYAYIASFACGFMIMFVLLGLFTEEVLQWIKKKQHVVVYTKMVGGLLILVMGGFMLMNGFKQVQNTNVPKVSEETQEEVSVTNEQNVMTTSEIDFTLMNAEGEEITLSSLTGKNVIINFFGTWCPYCMQEMPELQSVKDNNEDFVVLLVNMPDNGREGSIESVEKKMKDAGYDMEIVYDLDGAVTAKFGVRGFPSSYFVNTNGEYVTYTPGYVPPNKWEELLELVRTSVNR